MPFEKIRTVAAQILNRVPAVRGKGEQATKQSLVLPLIDALGYDIWDPAEVCPEYEADFAIKKAGQKEKVDIAILLAGVPRIYVEVKPLDELLEGHEGQVARYFNATRSVTLGILTNGIEWRFFTDTGDPNVMDAQPFHVARLDAADQGLDVVARFDKQVFSAEAIREYATELKYTSRMAEFLRQELDLKDGQPGEYFLRWVLKAPGMYDGVVNANVLDRFQPIAKDALTRVVREIVRRSIRAMEHEAASRATATVPQPTDPKATSPIVVGEADCSASPPEAEVDERIRPGIETTEKELRLFAVVKGQFDRSALVNATVYEPALRQEVPVVLSYKDTTGYFGIYFNKPSWWIMRANVEARRAWVGFDLDELAAAPLVPEEMVRLPAHPFASFRVQISSPEDVDKLHRLVFAAMEKAVHDRARTRESGEADKTPEG